MSDKEIDILARTVYGEARGECLSGMEAVASVVLNRLDYAKRRGWYWWGSSIIEICHKPWQFSCWNRDDPNYRIISSVPESDLTFCMCKRIAHRALSGVLEDATRRATHYHTRTTRPRWSIGKIPCAEIGNHLFYNDIEEL